MNSPGENLVEVLELLRNRLSRSGVERTFGLGKHMGKDCGYYKKSLTKFLNEDYVDIRNLIQQANEIIKIVEGK